MLKAEADRNYHGNVSALVAAMARELDRRAAAGEVLEWFGVEPMSAAEAEDFEAQVARELKATTKPKAAARPRARRRAA
ncbi:MAG: hypothetical protein KF819_36690 [Labilithrix sp.]|nr:hypothetical protein [Labilithrix sp.]